MEPDSDDQLSRLLREWQVGGAPTSLNERVLRRRPWWRFLFTGYIRVPVPVGLAVMTALALLAVFALRERARPEPPAGTVVSLRDFRPVQQPNVRIIKSEYANQ